VTYTDSTVTAGNTYDYRVYAVNANGQSAYSNTASVTTPALPPPAAPSNLVAALQAGPQVRLRWLDNANNETGFEVERSVNGGPFTLIATPGVSTGTGLTVTYFNTGLALGNTYAYRVRAMRGAAASAYSNTVTVVLPPAIPTNLRVTYIRTGTTDTVTVQWDDTSANETSFQLQAATNATFTSGVNNVTVPANTTIVTQTGLPRGLTYYLRIRATNATASSGWSNVVTVVTP
jgi:fibronectin type 3 domain-containing protein